MNKKRIIIISSIVLVILILTVGLYGILYLNKPKNIFLKNINNDYKKLSALIMEDDIDTKTIKSSNKVDFNIDISDEIIPTELLKEINNIELEFDSYSDLDKKLLNLLINLKYEKNDLLNLKVYGKPNSLYINMKDIYNKYIEIPYEEYSEIYNTVDNKEIKYVTDKTFEYIINNLNEKDFTKTKETININNKNVKVNKISYILNEEKFTNLSVNFIEKIKSDEKYLEILSKLVNETKEELVKELDDAKSEFNSKTEFDKTEIEFIMYTNGLSNNSIKYMIKSEDLKISYSNYNDIIKISVDEDENLISIVNEKKEKDFYNTTINIKIDESDEIKMNIDSKKEKDTWTHNYKITLDENEIKGTLILKEKEIEKNKEYEIDMNLNIEFMIDKEEFKFDINLKSNLKLNEEISIPDLSNSILYSDLTEEDTNMIMENLMNNETITNFITKITSAMNEAY